MKIVSAGIIEQNNKILITKRALTAAAGGMWEFPGGKQESGESIEECLVRELKEDLGLDIVVLGHLTRSRYKYSHGEFEIVAMWAGIIEGEIELKVHDDLAWVRSVDLTSYDLAPADIPVAEAICKTRKGGN